MTLEKKYEINFLWKKMTSKLVVLQFWKKVQVLERKISPETFCNYTLSTFNLRPFPTILRCLEEDHFCAFKDNGS